MILNLTAVKQLRPTSMFALPIMLALAGCTTVGPDYKRPDLATPANWTKGDLTQAPVSEKRWWLRLRDSKLDSLVTSALAYNTDVNQARARLEEARASYRRSTGALLPSLDGRGGISRQKTVEVAASQAESTSYQFGLDARWELDLFGGKRREAAGFFYGAVASEDALRLAQVTLVGDVVMNYVDACGYQARIALAERTAAAQRETAKLTKRQYDTGFASALDLAGANGQAANTEAIIPSLRISLAQSLNRLGVLTGRSTDELAKAVASGGLPRIQLPLPGGIPADILNARPDVRQAEMLLAQETMKIGAAEAERYPSISLVGNISTNAMRVGDLGSKSTIGWAFGPQLTVPLFNGGRLRANVEMVEASRDAAFQNYRGTVLKALEEVENSLVSLSQERARTAKLSSSVEHFRTASKLSRELHAAGSADFLAVLDADRSLYGAEDALTESRLAMVRAYISLNKSLGGGWSGIGVAK